MSQGFLFQTDTKIDSGGPGTRTEPRWIACSHCGSKRLTKMPDARFCTARCRIAASKARRAQAEQAKKERGKAVAAERQPELLELARQAARRVGTRDGDADIVRVREELARMGVELDGGPKAWMGSVFNGWKWTGRVTTCSHEGSHGRMVRVWRLV